MEEAIQHAAEQEIKRLADLVCAEVVEVRSGDVLEEDDEMAEEITQQQSSLVQGMNLSPRKVSTVRQSMEALCNRLDGLRPCDE